MPRPTLKVWLTNHRLEERSVLPLATASRELQRWAAQLISNHPDDWLDPPCGWWQARLSDGTTAMLTPDRKRGCLVATTILCAGWHY